MSSFIINIDFRNYNFHADLVSDLSPGFNAVSGDTVHLNINLNTNYKLLYSDMLLLLTAFVKHLRAIGVRVTGKFIDFDSKSDFVNYASRVNFFKEIGYNHIERFVRRSSIGKFLEISNYTNEQQYLEKHKHVITILKQYSSIKNNKGLLILLNYCLSEIMDNALLHSNSPTKGWVVCQYFPRLNEIRFMVCDTGIGIHKSLTETPNTQYGHYTKEESLLNCVNELITNGKGKGRGLFHTSMFIKENKGELIIHSGNQFLKIDESGKELKQANNWAGTFIFLKINTLIEMDPNKVVDEAYNIENNYNVYFNEEVDGLW